ncbi:DUF3370 domain-containing protein [Planktothrix mougeotii]|uniref:DUF3370 domain-containing protein n=1 Tax=Planktothrix mougeotii LEGE 06226 TaxID=1828728 RepID=A0ABR9U5M4_9CYAN|nr:DUF3370 domain-containing protein [Planktothrix mougeotii]MBE9141722.1 DUF3370 domain-containing protein [Planktothrix mougeotii LEGE 06226]
MKDQILHRIIPILIVSLSAMGGAVGGILFRQTVIVERFPTLLPRLPFANALPPLEIIADNEVRPLPGKLDEVLMFNSNSPEWIKQEGILLSTFPGGWRGDPEAHLEYRLTGEFEVFAHHFTHTPPDLKTLYLGLIVHNPDAEPVTVEVLTAASYLLEPDAPFKEKPAISDNTKGEIYSGPGIRAVDDVLREKRQSEFPETLELGPGESQMLMNLPIPVKGLDRPVNGRSTFMRLKVRGQTDDSAPASIYMASLALFAKMHPDGKERAPTLEEWQQLLDNGTLAQPRDQIPTPPEQTGGQLIYSRVAGVQEGAKWDADIVDEGKDFLTIPDRGKGISFPISTVRAGTLGTKQVQAAPLIVRYPDTAYESHGNYGVHYDLHLPLLNATDETQRVTITLETPFKEENLSKNGLIFRQPPLNFPFFRGTIRLRYEDEQEKTVIKYLHLWHRRGQIVDPLVKLKLNPQSSRFVRVDFRYPPDATPPQVLTIKTLD